MGSNSKSNLKGMTFLTLRSWEIESLDGVNKGISYQIMTQRFSSCVRPVLEYGSPGWYHKRSGQWKVKAQKVQNTGLRKILGVFGSVATKAMQYDAGILLVHTRIEEICNQLAVRAIQTVDPRNSCAEPHQLQQASKRWPWKAFC